MISREFVPSTIPIVSITGTNGKTTTTRMISRVLRQQGFTVGTTTSQGIYVNGRLVESGDTTGPLSAKRVLTDPAVDVAVLETARGGIVRKGLGYQMSDVAVFTNLTLDHLGIDGIETMEELLEVKSRVIEAVSHTGVCVLNADDSYVMSVRSKAKGEQILFSINPQNPILLAHMKNRGTAVYLSDQHIVITRQGVITTLAHVKDIPATLNGKLEHNCYNSLAAIGACLGLGISLDVIREGLRQFTCDPSCNPGRFNIYDLGDFKVVLDFGHNIEGYRATIKGLKKLTHSRLIGILRAPGDRQDEHILSIGKISGSSFDHVIIREDKDLRGRNPLEVANLLQKGALSGGLSYQDVEIIPDEEEALKKAIKDAQQGEIITLFFEKMEPLMRILKNYQSSNAI